MILEFSWHWPFVRTHRCSSTVVRELKAWESYRHKSWVILPDGRTGVIHHEKTDGSIAVRPITDQGDHYPNTSAHWSMADRMRIPEEIALARDAVRAAQKHELPRPLR